MKQLQTLGVNFTIDDLGAGCSSLSALQSFPVARLKIDRSFISNLANNPDDQNIGFHTCRLRAEARVKAVKGIRSAALKFGSGLHRQIDCRNARKPAMLAAPPGKD